MQLAPNSRGLPRLFLFVSLPLVPPAQKKSLGPNKYKELVGLGISVVSKCRYCTLYHTEVAWLPAIRADRLTIYELDPRGFTVADEIAGCEKYYPLP